MSATAGHGGPQFGTAPAITGMEALPALAVNRERFWVESNPDTETPYWHPGVCYMEVAWDRSGRQRPKRTVYGITGYAQLCNVLIADPIAEVGKTFLCHVCADIPCKAQWEATKYGRGADPPLHVRQADPPVEPPAEPPEEPSAASVPIIAGRPSEEPAAEPAEPPAEPTEEHVDEDEQIIGPLVATPPVDEDEQIINPKTPPCGGG